MRVASVRPRNKDLEGVLALHRTSEVKRDTCAERVYRRPFTHDYFLAARSSKLRMFSLLDLLWPRPSFDLAMDDPRFLAHLNPIRLTRPLLRRRGIRHVSLVVAAGTYRDPKLRASIRALKYDRNTLLTSVIAAAMARAVPGLLTVPDETVLVPVPLHWFRRKMRGFNQSELLAKEIATYLKMRIRMDLVRMRPTGAQALRPRSQRLRAVHDAFRWTGGRETCVVLVDDLCTTGSTLDACAFALKSAGIRHIAALVAALG